MLFLDAEHYLNDIGAAEIVEQLQRDGVLAPLLPAYVSHIDYPTRWRESFCNQDFGAFLSTELLPWLTATFDVDTEHPNALVGLSLTGLAAAHAALHHPDALPRALCQSASFWWNEGWLIDDISNLPASDLALCLSVGLQEVDENVDHGDGLFQIESQLSANRRMRDAIARKGFRHLYHEFDGGHDLDSFRRDLPHALRQLEQLRQLS
jgi:enterochelin esterase family protein